MSQLRGQMDERLRGAIRHFWTVRNNEPDDADEQEETKQRSGRDAVVGGKQMDGFLRLIHDLLVEAGLGSASIYCAGHPSSFARAERKKRKRIVCDPDAPSCTATELPGWFRAEKDWDVVVILNRQIIAAVELKTQVGSLGNNFNNRAEEAIGNATDLWTAYREGAFAPSPRPWVGYLMLLEDSAAALRPVRVSEPHFNVFPDFKDASYAKRYELLLTKAVRERLYDGACLLMSSRSAEVTGEYREPAAELRFINFIEPLLANAIAAARLHGTGSEAGPLFGEPRQPRH